MSKKELTSKETAQKKQPKISIVPGNDTMAGVLKKFEKYVRFIWSVSPTRF
jgi:hypothetical protein